MLSSKAANHAANSISRIRQVTTTSNPRPAVLDLHACLSHRDASATLLADTHAYFDMVYALHGSVYDIGVGAHTPSADTHDTCDSYIRR